MHERVVEQREIREIGKGEHLLTEHETELVKRAEAF
jgi:hypothetical protein